MAQFKMQENKVITGLLTIVFSLTGIAYNNVTSRVSNIEKNQKDSSPIETALQVQTAVLAEQTRTLEVNSEKLDAQLAAIVANQQITAAQLQEMSAQLAIIRRLFGHDSKDYQDALQNWRDIVSKKKSR